MWLTGLSKAATGRAVDELKDGAVAQGCAVNEPKDGEDGVDRVQKIVWPDLVFAPVNLWSLPSAAFFYRNQGSG